MKDVWLMLYSVQTCTHFVLQLGDNWESCRAECSWRSYARYVQLRIDKLSPAITQLRLFSFLYYKPDCQPVWSPLTFQNAEFSDKIVTPKQHLQQSTPVLIFCSKRWHWWRWRKWEGNWKDAALCPLQFGDFVNKQ